jgi:hypothetical protein
MNYVLVSLGPTPPHLRSCLRQILSVDTTSKIYLITDQNIVIENVNIINKNDLSIPDIGNYLKYNPDPLWYTSLLRIFLLNTFIQNKKEPTIHFDNDVLVYYPSSVINNITENKVYITPHKKTEFTFGFSVIKNFSCFNDITKKIYSLILQGEGKVKEMLGETHEMRLLGYCGHDLITPLPVHPTFIPNTQYIFDPSSYGQFIDGTPNGHSPGFIDSTQIVGGCLQKTPPNIIFKNKKPLLVFNKKEYKIYNLHVHSKNLQKYEA